MWNYALTELTDHRVSAAYKRVLNSGDDLYLIRLMHKTGNVLNKLGQVQQTKIIRRICPILNSFFVEAHGVRWLQAAIRYGVFQSLPEEDQQLFIDTCYKLSAVPGEDGVRAAQIYTHLTDSE
jgi:hypothetical protein